MAIATLLYSLTGLSANYSFKSQFNDNDTVSYSGQVFRNLLNEELKNSFKYYKRGSFIGSPNEVTESIWSYIDYKSDNDSLALYAIHGDAEMETAPQEKGKSNSGSWQEGFTFSDVATNKQILNKLAGNDNPLVHGKILGWNLNPVSTPEELLKHLSNEVAKNAANPGLLEVQLPSGDLFKSDAAYLSKDGLDYSQLIQKVIYGAMNFSQMARDYLSTDLGPGKGLNADNESPDKKGASYTTLEHHWDEAFGYFGAARDYLSYSDTEIKAGISIDTDNSGAISLNSEKNFAFSVLAAKRDLGSNTHFTETLFNLFLKGRKLITEKPQNYKDDLVQVARQIIDETEKVIAASVVHYINSTIGEMDKMGSNDYNFALHAKYWSEMKGYALAFQFNPHSVMSINDFVQLHVFLGNMPVVDVPSSQVTLHYKQSLLEARNLLKSVYEFEEDQIVNW